MARVVTISDDADFAWLQDYIDRWAQKSQLERAAYSEYIDKFSRLKADFAAAVKVKSENEPAPKVKEKKTGTVVDFNYCNKHKSYGAKRMPRTACDDCWEAYIKLNPMNVAQAKRIRAIRNDMAKLKRGDSDYEL